MASEAQKRMAAAYISPQIAKIAVFGERWKAAARAAGYSRIPSTDNAVLRQLIVEAGGVIEEQYEPETTDEVPGIDEDAQAALAEVNTALLEGRKVDWTALGRKLLPTWNHIALGNMDATPGQRAAMKDIMDRAFGKAGRIDEDDTESEIGVVVLPTLGAEAGIQVCPNCLHRLK